MECVKGDHAVRKWILLEKQMGYATRGFSTRLAGGPVAVIRSVYERRVDKGDCVRGNEYEFSLRK